MKTLVVYYSRTETTKKVAEEIASKLDSEVEEIRDTVNRKGIWGWLISGRDGMKRRLTKLYRMEKNPADYDLVIVGTPIWAGNVSAPTRTYLTAFKNKFKKVAFFCTMGGRGDENAFKEMEEVVGQKPIATLALVAKEVSANNYTEEIGEFLNTISSVQ